MQLVGTTEERGYETCQLYLRHWVITGGPQTQHVNGEGVIGLFPILTEDGWLVNQEMTQHHPRSFAICCRSNLRPVPDNMKNSNSVKNSYIFINITVVHCYFFFYLEITI